MRILAINRPAIIESDIGALDREFRAARWTHHRLLDFEQRHQDHMNEVAELCAPGIRRVGALVARLKRREKRAERSTGWSPPLHTNLRLKLETKLTSLRKQRNSDPRWTDALKWADAEEPNGPPRGKARRRPDETDEEFKARQSTRRNVLTRREAYRAELYANRTVYWGTWNGLVKQVDQARSAVLKRRKEGLPADWQRPRGDSPCTIYADVGFRVAQHDDKHWTVEMRLNDGWARFRLSSRDKLHSEFEEIRNVSLTRKKNGAGWSYSVSIVVSGAPSAGASGNGMVALNAGYREHGHDTSKKGIRAFTWVGDDGAMGE